MYEWYRLRSATVLRLSRSVAGVSFNSSSYLRWLEVVADLHVELAVDISDLALSFKVDPKLKIPSFERGPLDYTCA